MWWLLKVRCVEGCKKNIKKKSKKIRDFVDVIAKSLSQRRSRARGNNSFCRALLVLVSAYKCVYPKFFLGHQQVQALVGVILSKPISFVTFFSG